MFQLCLKSNMHFLSVPVETIQFLTPLKDVNLDKVGIQGVFKCEVSKTGLKPEWFHKEKPLSRSIK